MIASGPRAPRSERSAPRFRLGRVALAALAATAALVAGACASGDVSNVKCDHDVRIVNGEFDYGVSVAADVKNTGDTGGDIALNVFLSTSEGEWKRSQTLTFDKGQAQHFEWFFAEPTINATNIQCRVTAFP